VSELPHFEHRRGSGAPHCSQNFACEAFPWPHWEHVMGRAVVILLYHRWDDAEAA
jgi:hypothetical protein